MAIKDVSKKAFGTLFIVIGSLFIFGSWISHDYFKEDYEGKKTEVYYDQFFMNQEEISSDILRHYHMFLQTDSSLEAWDFINCYTIFAYNTHQLEEFLIAIKDSHFEDEKKVADTVYGIMRDNTKFYSLNNIDSLNNITLQIHIYDSLHNNALQHTRKKNLDDVTKGIYSSSFWYFFFYLLGSVCFSWGFYLKNSDAIGKNWKLFFR